MTQQSNAAENIGPHAPFSNAEWETLIKTPVLVFLMVSAMDGKIDQKEVKGFQKVLTEAITYKSELLRKVLAETIEKIPTILQSILSGGFDAGKTLREAREMVDRCLPKEEAELFKQSLLFIGKQIAESSGGFLGFGSKISKEEQAALFALAVTLGIETRG